MPEIRLVSRAPQIAHTITVDVSKMVGDITANLRRIGVRRSGKAIGPTALANVCRIAIRATRGIKPVSPDYDSDVGMCLGGDEKPDNSHPWRPWEDVSNFACHAQCYVSCIGAMF